jgi:hypothetical protein
VRTRSHIAADCPPGSGSIVIAAQRSRRCAAAALALAVLLLAPVAGCERRLPAGRVAPRAPVQENLQPPGEVISMGDCALTPLARFRLTARVLGATRYSLDREAKLAPVDLALGWGPMSDNAVLEDLHISQMSRFYTWSGRELPLEPEQITANSANMHMIPADPGVRRTLLRVHRNDIVELSGFLVSIRSADGWIWRSSMSRTDSGDGACEVVWVDSLAVR